MALYRTIQMSFWTDIKISESFTPEDKYFYLYLFTNPHTNLAGCYEISIRQAATDTGYSKDTIERLFKRFSEVHKVAFYSSETNEVLLVNWHKYNWTSSEKYRKPLETQIRNIKNESFREYLYKLFENEDRVSIPYQYPIDTYCIDTSNANTITNTNNINNKNINNIYINNNKNIYSISFENIYNEYPRKGDKKKAYGCFQARLKEGYSEDELLIATKNYAEQCKKEKREQRYIKLASTFFGVNTPFVDYLPHGISGKPNMKVEWGKMIRDLSEQEHAPYFGFPPEWFDGDKLIQERVESVICPKGTMPGIYEDYEMSVKELLETYEARRRYANGDTIDFFEYPECTSDS